VRSTAGAARRLTDAGRPAAQHRRRGFTPRQPAAEEIPRAVGTFPAALFPFLHAPHYALSCRMRRPRIRFAPVPTKARHDGWTPARQCHFIEQLAATRSITRACAAVGMSRESAYKLRDRTDAAQFRLAWNAALRPGFEVDRRRPQRPLAKRLLIARNRPEIDDVEETQGARDLLMDSQSTSSALETLRTYLAELRRSELQLGSTREG